MTRVAEINLHDCNGIDTSLLDLSERGTQNCSNDLFCLKTQAPVISSAKWLQGCNDIIDVTIN